MNNQELILQNAPEFLQVAALHRKAMDFAEEATIAKLECRNGDYQFLIASAFQLEKLSAELVAEQWKLEPTRSVLHRSAASLAMECGQYGEAANLIAKGLQGSPPIEIAEELRDLRQSIENTRSSHGSAKPRERNKSKSKPSQRNSMELTQAQRVLLAAHQLERLGQSPFSAEALIVACWKATPKAFGLRGFLETYPDSNRILMLLMGERGLARQGLLQKEGVKLYTLSERGRKEVERLRRVTKPANSNEERIRIAVPH